MIIEMCDDIIRVSHGFEGCQTLKFIETMLKIAKINMSVPFLNSLCEYVRTLDKVYCGLFKGTQKSDESRIRFNRWRTASGQMEYENQK